MANANLYGLSSSDEWVPIRVNATGAVVSSGGGASSGIPSGQPEALTPWSYAAASGGITDTADVTLIAAGGAGKSNYLTSLQVENVSATATEIVIKSGATVLWRGRVGASMTAPVGIDFLRPLISANNTALTAACITGATQTYINAQGYTDETVSQINADLTSAFELFDAAGDPITDAAGVQITTLAA